MSQSPSSDAPSGPPLEQAPEAFEMLRELLLGREKRELDGLRERVDNPRLRARDASQVLPQAVALAASRGPELASALAPAVESALTESVRRDPTPLVNAIFPIIGPVIRKAVAEALGRLVQSLNQTLDNSLSLRSLRWRLEARRSGRSFAEVVLAHTLIYRVEQVLLIHRHTGLLLLQVRAPHVQSEDAGMVSGMLTAIQDFARDSFHVPAGETVHTLQVGELTVWVETSPLLTLAAVIRGQAPGDFRDTLQTALENVHRAHAPELEAFDGDAAQFESARAHLEPCVRAQFAEPARRNSGSWLVIGLSAIVLLLAVWAFVVVRESRRWSGYLDRLKAEPGIVVIEARARGGKFYVTGLRDPLAADPAAFLSGFHLGADQVVSHWEPYHALGPPLVVKRAAQLLEPPASVTLRVQDGVLSAEGIAPAAWVETARQRAVLLPGIHRFDSTGLTDGAWARLSDGQREIEQTVVFFDEGVHLIPGQEAVLERLATRLISLGREAGQSGRRIRVSVLGHTDQTGTDEYNDRLSRQRADQVVSLLTAQGVPATGLAPRGVGSQHPWRAGGAEDLGPNRRVTFRVALDESAADTVTP